MKITLDTPVARSPFTQFEVQEIYEAFGDRRVSASLRLTAADGSEQVRDVVLWQADAYDALRSGYAAALETAQAARTAAKAASDAAIAAAIAEDREPPAPADLPPLPNPEDFGPTVYSQDDINARIKTQLT